MTQDTQSADKCDCSSILGIGFFNIMIVAFQRIADIIVFKCIFRYANCLYIFSRKRVYLVLDSSFGKNVEYDCF